MKQILFLLLLLLLFTLTTEYYSSFCPNDMKEKCGTKYSAEKHSHIYYCTCVFKNTNQ